MEQHDFSGSVQAVTWKIPPQTKEEALERLCQSPALYRSYRRMNSSWKERFLDFCQGKKSLPLTYDPFFKYLFDPDIHGDRLSRFISSLLGFEVKILEALPGEDRLIDGESYLIMDLLARLYVIVLFEESTALFHQFPDIYLHHGKTVFDSGLKMELLQEFYLIALDVFRKIPYPESEKNEQRAWLSLLTTESLKDAEKLIQDYPWLEEIYQEIAMLRQRPEEVLEMWSDALRILDENSMKFYVEELEEKVRQLTKEKDEQLLQVTKEKDAEIAALKKQLEAINGK